MNRSFRTLFVLCTFACTVLNFAQAQGLTANDDLIKTGPSQTVRKSIILNDIIPGETYSWKLINPPAAAQGTATIQGEYLVFTPATGYHGTVSMAYELSGSGSTDSAFITVIVSEYNNPANIIDSDVKCYDYMPTNIQFGIHSKYTSSPKSTANNWIDAMSSPLVGDLNGDGKPEIVMLGLMASTGTNALDAQGKYINIYNGQDGTRIYQFDFITLGNPYEAMNLPNPVAPVFYHRAPVNLALADLDNDGKGEIIMCHTTTGRITALKPVLDGTGKIIGLSQMWEGKDYFGDIVSFKAPLTSTSVATFGMPQPYIADLNGDGIPEVIVYNKIYNGLSGKLLMSWQNAAPVSNPRTSSYTSADGLSEQNSSNPLNEIDAVKIRGKAMTGRRTRDDAYSDRPVAVPAIVDIDGDGKQEIITGNRIYKFNFNSLDDHTLNTYYTIEGPQSVIVTEGSSDNSTKSVTYNLSDGFTRVADIDGDGALDIVVETFGNKSNNLIYHDNKIVVFVWDAVNPGSVKACVSFTSYNSVNTGGSIPFIGEINGKLDGYNGSAWTRKLPEICILGGGMYINRSSSDGGRTGVSFHPKANASELTGKFNKVPSNAKGHIIGLTWDASANSVEEKLKISWGMEHADASTVTGITLFDFDNNNTADLCYRDERTLRVISPARSGKDYVEVSETTVTPTSSVMFSASCFSGTGYEYPVIADVNMDGSADIVVTNIGSYSLDRTQGYFEVYEYLGTKWAPCPPVWNQSMYDPTQVRENLKINARPISMLTPFVKNNETIMPYNGSWVQQPIVRDGDNYVPVVRKPDAILLDMKVKVVSNTLAEVTLTIRNSGSASINEQTPITFYDGGTLGKAIGSGAIRIGNAQPVDVDIFPDEKIVKTYTVSGNFNDHLIWARIMDDGSHFPATGYEDCDISNNTFSGIDCPYLIYTVTASPDTVLCGTIENVKLTAEPNEPPHHDPAYQWYRNDVAIQGATSQTYTATLAGEYKCYVIEDVCRGFSSVITITRETPVAVDDNHVIVHGIPKYINVLQNDTKSQYCNAIPDIAAGDEPKNGTATVQPDGTILYKPNPGVAASSDSMKYTIGNISNKATVRILLYPIPNITLTQPTKTDTTVCAGSSFTLTGNYTDTDVNGETFGNDLVYRWEYSATLPAVWTVAGTQGTSNNGTVTAIYTIHPVHVAHAGYYRLLVANSTYIENPDYRAVSDTVHIRVNSLATAANITLKDTNICYNTNVTLTASAPNVINPVYSWYVSQTATNPFHTEATYTASALTTDATFYISVKGSNYCENEIDSRKAVKVMVYPELTGGTIGTSQTYCYGGVMSTIYLGTNPSVGGSGKYAYSWQESTNGSTWSDVGVSTQTYNISGVLTQTMFYRRVVTDTLGCGTVYSDTITVHPVPAVSIGTTDLCVDITTQLPNSAQGTWVSSNDTVAKVNSNSSVTGISAGTATLTYTSSATNCFVVIPVTVDSFPVVADITGKEVVCTSQSIELSNATPNGTWTSSNHNVTLSNPTDNPVTVTGETEGKAYITYTVYKGACQTKQTHLLKIISNTLPETIIGIGR